MSYAIVGFGTVGQALARAFARKNIEVAVASRRPNNSVSHPSISGSSKRVARLCTRGTSAGGL